MNVHLDNRERVALLLEDYAYFAVDPDYLCERLEVLVPFRGRAVVQRWQALARQHDLTPVVTELLETHYDPAYAESISRNFECYKYAKTIAPADRSENAMAALAARLIESVS